MSQRESQIHQELGTYKQETWHQAVLLTQA